MPTLSEQPRVVEFWGGPNDGLKVPLDEFLKNYPKGIASFPIPGTSLLHVYKVDLTDPSGRVVYTGEFTPEDIAKLSTN